MTTSSKDDTCLKVCWGIAAVAGLGLVVILNAGMWFLVALALGAAFAFGMGLVLQKQVCGFLGNPLEDTTVGELIGTEPISRDKLEAMDMAETEAPAPPTAPPPKPAPPVSAAQPAAVGSARDTAASASTPEPEPETRPAPPVAVANPAEGALRKPETLDAPRGDGPDDLKKIKGVGPKLEALLHKLGFYHFDQIAAWTDEEIAWVDENLEGFKGRVTRDGWVAQAKELAAGKGG